MTLKPRTIDNLGIDASVRYAQDLEQIDRRLIEESKWLPDRTVVSVAKPYIPTEFEKLFSLPQARIWATFMAPSDYYDRIGRFFSYQLIPSLGSYEKQEDDTDKLTALEDALNKPFDQQSSSDQEQEQEENERQILMAFMETLTKFDRALSLINSRRNQYHRG